MHRIQEPQSAKDNSQFLPGGLSEAAWDSFSS